MTKKLSHILSLSMIISISLVGMIPLLGTVWQAQATNASARKGRKAIAASQETQALVNKYKGEKDKAEAAVTQAQNALNALTSPPPGSATPEAIAQAEFNLTAAQSALNGAEYNLAVTQNVAIEEAMKAVDAALKIQPDGNPQIANLNQKKQDLLKQKKQNERIMKTSLSNRKYNDLINATREQGKRIPDGNNLQKQANQSYIVYLETKKAYENCVNKAPPSPPPPNCSTQQSALTKAADTFKKNLKALTEQDIKKNQEMQLEVSKIFSIQTDGNTKLSLLKVTDTIANWAIALVSSLAVTTMIIGGFMMLISAGDETRLELGKTIFIYSLIGMAVTLLAYGIIASIQGIFYGSA